MSPAVSAVIGLDAFRQNLQAIRRRIPPGTPVCPAVKANAYGHGVDLLLPVLEKEGIEALAVAQLEEAVQLRQLGWRRRVLCLGAPLVGESPADRRERTDAAVAGGIEVTVSSHNELDLLSQAAARLCRKPLVHIKVDTGMGRMGVLASDASQFVLAAARRPELVIAGVYTHFATADEPDLAFAREQLTALLTLRQTLLAARCPVQTFHAANSAAIFRLPDASLDMVRPGLAIYGYWGSDPTGRPADLRPILRVVSRIVSVRDLPAGASIGYGRTFRTQRRSRIGVIPIGYADGYRRALSSAATMVLEARRSSPRQSVPVVGRVSMDLVSIDLTDVPDAQVGDPVTVVDNVPQAPNSVESIARQLGTIPYEVTCSIGPRVRRIVADDRAAPTGTAGA